MNDNFQFILFIIGVIAFIVAISGSFKKKRPSIKATNSNADDETEAHSASQEAAINHMRIVVPEGTEEEWLMKQLVCIIEGNQFIDQFPQRIDSTFKRSFRLDSRNDWFASLVRKGDRLHVGEPPVGNDTLDIWCRYGKVPLMALRPWLEYRFSPRVDLAIITLRLPQGGPSSS